MALGPQLSGDVCEFERVTEIPSKMRSVNGGEEKRKFRVTLFGGLVAAGGVLQPETANKIGGLSKESSQRSLSKVDNFFSGQGKPLRDLVSGKYNQEMQRILSHRLGSNCEKLCERG